VENMNNFQYRGKAKKMNPWANDLSNMNIIENNEMDSLEDWDY